MYEWLRDYKRLEEDILYLDFELSRNKRELGRWMYGDLQDIKLNEKSKASQLEEVVRDIEHEMAHKMNDLYNAKQLIKRFKGLDNQILYGKYVEGKTLTEIAYELDYAPGHIYNKHAQIMKMINFALHVNLS
ncbi:hypothetical protein [Gracilibacillus alcaliphilus]|uniref:hypothetical protein n=1 Tax=Gracilibacillus alcaliphilus TaxID=1401441 RepID=UPI00195EA72B|nr:hypothetical protein [Gracilibacillus alcaliphilus]